MSHVQSEKEVSIQLQAIMMHMTSRLLQRKPVEKLTEADSIKVLAYVFL